MLAQQTDEELRDFCKPDLTIYNAGQFLPIDSQRV